MKIAIVYNRNSKSVINLFGMPNREKIGMQTIKRLADALKGGGHQVVALEGDKDIIERLEEFMPRVVKGERPGLVFNVSYGIQGQARYTHVPSILEMVGIPYVASGPLAHTLALDKVVTKMILRQHDLPTPEFAVLQDPDAPIPEMTYPVIVKPKNEAVSFGLKVCKNEKETRDGAGVIFKEFGQAVLIEQFIGGREINVGILGNNPPEAFPPVQLDFGAGPGIYTYEDKTGRSGRSIGHICPAPIGDELTARAKDVSVKAFKALGLYDCCRVDMRLDGRGNLYILEVNSLPSLGEHGSYLVGAAAVGLDFPAFVNRLVEVASARYFGTPEPPTFDDKTKDPSAHAFSFITQRRDELEKRLRGWVAETSRTLDPVGLQQAWQRAGKLFEELGMKPVKELTDEPEVATWETVRGFEGGTLLVAHVDIPIDVDFAPPVFRRDPEWLYGEGVGSRACLVSLEFALRNLRSLRKLRTSRIGVLFYFDEGFDARSSAQRIREASGLAKQVLVLRPGIVGDLMVVKRRGQRRYRLTVEGEPNRIGRASKRPEALRWTWQKLEQCAKLSTHMSRVSVSTTEVKSDRLPMRVPHRVTVSIVLTFPDDKAASLLEERMRGILGKGGLKWDLKLIAHRPAMPERRSGLRLAKQLENVAADWEIPLARTTSGWPSVAGLVPARTATICGIGPVSRDLRTPDEAVQRISLVQRTLLLADFLAREEAKASG
ncbi:MAG TPA: D-alanine--D-alanine ligase [Vicinamibacteria bacterium]|nr:D-alanine--D-alanine ligase [Vicinamibacteria bacterium]